MDTYEFNVLMKNGTQDKVRATGHDYKSAHQTAKNSNKKIVKIISGRKM